MFNRRTLPALMLFVLAFGTTFCVPAVASEVENCADFSSQQEAAEWFEEHDGSKANNAGGLDADRDGIPCEHLLAASVSDDDSLPIWLPIAGGVTLLAGIGVGGAWYINTRRSRSSAVPSPKSTPETSFRPVVPEARKIVESGILILRLTAAPGTGPFGEIQVDVDGETTLQEWPVDASHLEVMREVPAGDRMLSVGTPSQPDMVVRLVTVVRDDVTRVDIEWPSASIDGDSEAAT